MTRQSVLFGSFGQFDRDRRQILGAFVEILRTENPEVERLVLESEVEGLEERHGGGFGRVLGAVESEIARNDRGIVVNSGSTA